MTFGNGSVQSFGYDPVSRLSTLANNLGGSATTHDLTQTFTYNPASQIASVTRSNDAYAWQAHYNVDRSYTINGLNRIMNVGSTAFTYDARGNLTSDGTNAFTYTAENLLETGPASATLGYDPLGRLYQTVGGGVTTRLQYDGADLIAEYDGSNTVQRRYVHGPGIDNPIVWYEGSGTSDRRFLMADERGSIVSVTDSGGTTLNINAYDEYGIPAPGNIGRFGYTGQAWLPDLGMWYYKARIYSPTLGRFMQTDPIGYQDGMNWYNYVGSDPVNFSDTSGLGADRATPHIKPLDPVWGDIVVKAPRIERAPLPTNLGTIGFSSGAQRGGGGRFEFPATATQEGPQDDGFFKPSPYPGPGVCQSAFGNGAIEGATNPEALVGDALGGSWCRIKRGKDSQCSFPRWARSKSSEILRSRSHNQRSDSGSGRWIGQSMENSRMQPLQMKTVISVVLILALYWAMVFFGLTFWKAGIIAGLVCAPIAYFSIERNKRS